ncbi:UDP-N-acetylmuramoyl-tripeptide--D-alanyl-D-alanine ligase [Desertivirga brevis]|uniref:UDP-N-acetylmuramoyl-tripeptide--D-alanyl-D- alanine ligase n=1 Tax=Desertivirga brevis TaxID=2810310 RepID=UPI001A9589CE|nr:UDP-N-acetylmuramoyl-tripeptide--D-alanyl-D-alanine ligase [Pedobacter sp. SYSU D00873]
MTTEELYNIYLQYPTVCTDTRKIVKGCLFFALKGDNFDGNAFAEMAINEGAEYAVIDDPKVKKDDRYLVVEDVLVALQELARYHRKQLTIPFIGITGTNGKTTTKELLNSVLSQKYKTYATQGNLNNHIGVPLTLLAIGKDIELAIIEMGANHQKEIGFLSSIAQPTHGLITNVGKAHLEGFGGFEGVKKGKGELYDFLKSSGGTIFTNKTNPHLLEMSENKNLQNIIFYGNAEGSEVSGEITENDPYLKVTWKNKDSAYSVKTNLTGAYNLENILAAATLGLHFNLSPSAINEGIMSYVPGNNRSQVTKTDRNTLICDYYNANPSSMAVALENFESLQSDNKVIILGDMFELGDESAQEHIAILSKASSTNATDRIFIGKEFYKGKNNFPGNFFESTTDAMEYLKLNPLINATVLIKGSRGMRLENLANLL